MAKGVRRDVLTDTMQKRYETIEEKGKRGGGKWQPTGSDVRQQCEEGGGGNQGREAGGWRGTSVVDKRDEWETRRAVSRRLRKMGVM